MAMTASQKDARAVAQLKNELREMRDLVFSFDRELGEMLRQQGLERKFFRALSDLRVLVTKCDTIADYCAIGRLQGAVDAREDVRSLDVELMAALTAFVGMYRQVGLQDNERLARIQKAVQARADAIQRIPQDGGTALRDEAERSGDVRFLLGQMTGEGRQGPRPGMYRRRLAEYAKEYRPHAKIEWLDAARALLRDLRGRKSLDDVDQAILFELQVREADGKRMAQYFRQTYNTETKKRGGVSR